VETGAEAGICTLLLLLTKPSSYVCTS
jgi:hypothetical protein